MQNVAMTCFSCTTLMLTMGWNILLQIVDLATLTGACVVALGPSIAGKVYIYILFLLRIDCCVVYGINVFWPWVNSPFQEEEHVMIWNFSSNIRHLLKQSQ